MVHGPTSLSLQCLMAIMMPHLRMKLEETVVIKVLYELRGVTQLLAITRNYKPQALGMGGGVGVRPPLATPCLKMS